MQADECLGSNTSSSDALSEQSRPSRRTEHMQVPVLKLPTEILALIFERCHDCEISYRGQWSCMDNITWKGFISIAHVCRRWRSAVFDCPFLWSRIIFSSQDVMEEMLSRSQGSPLIIRIPPELKLDKLPPTLAQRFLDLEHVQELHVRLPAEALGKLLTSVSGSCATHLRSMIIDSPVDYHEDTTYCLPPNILLMRMPSLRHLRVSNCGVQWDLLCSCVSHPLVSLTLDPLSKPTRDQFFDLLSMVPNLESLRLYSKALPPPPTAPNKARIVVLPKLRSCSISDTLLEEFFDFQTQVSYPMGETSLFLSFYIPDFSQCVADVETLVRLCGLSLYAPHRPRTHLQLDISHNFWRSDYKLTLWDSVRALPAVRKNHLINIDVCGRHEGQGLPPLIDLLSIPGLENAAFTLTGVSVYYDPNAWFGFFKRHAGITELGISSASVQSIITALSTSADNECIEFAENDNEDGGQCSASHPTAFHSCLPNLISLNLTVHGATISKEVYDCEFDQFLDYLRKCRKRGAPLRKLSLTQCFWIDARVVRMLKREVGEVVWDKVLLPVEDDDSEDSHNCL